MDKKSLKVINSPLLKGVRGLLFLLVPMLCVGTQLLHGNEIFAEEGPEVFVQLGHTATVNSVAFSPDGRYALSGSGDETLKLWDITTGREIRTFTGHTGDVNSVAISPDGKYILSGSNDKTIKLWDISTGSEIRTFTGYSEYSNFRSIAFSPAGRYIASASGVEGILRLWDFATGREIWTFKAYLTNPSIAFSSDNRYILLAAFEEIKLIDVATGGEIRTFERDSRGISSVAFSPDGRYALSGNGEDKTLKLWDISTGKTIRTFVGHEDPVTSVAFSPDGKYVLSGSGDNIGKPKNVLKLWDVSTGREVRTFAGHSGKVTSVVFSLDGRYVLSGSTDRSLKLWEVTTGNEIRTFGGNSSSVSDVAFTSDGRFVIHKYHTRHSGGNRLWDISKAEALKAFDGYYLHISPAGAYVFLKENETIKLKLLDTVTGKEIRSFQGDDLVKKYISAFSPDGRYVLLREKIGDKRLNLYDIIAGKKTGVFIEEEGYQSVRDYNLAFSPDGKYILSVPYNSKIIRLWNAATGKEIKTFTGHSREVKSAIFSPDGKYILSGSWDNTLKLWDVATGKEIRTFTGNSGGIIPIAFSPDGKYIISGSGDTAKLWEVETGRELRTFTGHDFVKEVRFSPDGRYVITVGNYYKVRIWDVFSGKEVAQLANFDDGEWVVMTPEGYFNASPNGAKHLNVRIGNNVYSIDNFYEKFFNPVYVASVLQGKKVEAVADIRKGFLTPPDIKITSPEAGATFDTDTITITVSARDTGGGIDEIRLYHNGKAIGEDTRAVKIIPRGNEMTKTYTVTLIDGMNTFRAVGFSKDRTESNPYELIVKLTAPQKDVSLYVFAVGINKYKNPALNLNYAEPDAKGIVDFFKQKGTGLFKKIEIIDIYNEQGTKETIISKLKQLQDIQPQDAVLIYLAGHGEDIEEKWYFIPHELTYPEREDDVKTKGISSDELSGYVKNIKAQKVLILIDACKSGAVLIAFRGFEDRKALSQLSRSAGVHIVAASTKDQFASEVKELGHGVFTYTLLEGLKGKASGGSETVTVRKLMGYVEEQLPDITKKYKQEAQYPVVDSRGMDFPLVIVK